MSSRSAADRPLTVAVVGDTRLVEAGVAGLLAGRSDMVVVSGALSHASQRIGPAGAEPAHELIDVAIVDMVGGFEAVEVLVTTLVADQRVAEVALLALDFAPSTVRAATRIGVRGFLTKSLGADELGSALLAIGRGERVEALVPGPRRHDRTWAGRDHGLTEREGQVLALAAEGRTNREIADALFVGVETVRTHLKRAYQRLGVRNRAEAARYVHDGETQASAPPRGRTAPTLRTGHAADLAAVDLDVESRAHRLALMQLDEEARRRLAALGPAVRARAHDFVQRLTSVWLAHNETAGLLRDPGVLERLQDHQRRYLAVLFEGRYDDAHVATMIRSGAVHHRIRLSPEWYVGSLAHVIGDHVDLVWSRSTDDADAVETLVALTASVFFDATLVIDAYGTCVEREVTAALTPAPGRAPAPPAAPPVAPPRRPLTRLGDAADDEAATRRRFVGIDDGHVRALRELGPVLEQAMPDVLARFYDLIGSSETLAELVPTAVVPRLMDEVATFWSETVAGPFDDVYAASRKRVGVMHERIGVGAQAYLAGLACQVAGILRSLPGSGVDVRTAAEALVRAALFDATFVIDAYVEARADALLQFGRFAVPVVAGLANGVAVVDARDRVAYANEQLLDMVGIAAGVLHRLPVSSAIPLEGIDDLVERARGVDGRVSQVHEAWGRQVRVTAVALQQSVTGQAGLVAVVLDDITDILAASAGVEREERRLDHVLECIDAVVWELDRGSMTVVAVSSASARVFGVRDLDLLGRPGLAELVHPDDRSGFVIACRGLRPDERTVLVHRITMPGGRSVRVQSSLVGSLSPSGSPTVSGVSVRLDDLPVDLAAAVAAAQT